MKLKPRHLAWAASAAAISVFGLGAVSSVQAAETSAPADSVVAYLDGQPFNPADGWGEATACIEHGDTMNCYRTERELIDAETIDQRTTHSALGGITPMSSCGSSLRLYDGTGQGIPSLYLTTRGTPLNMSVYGFDNLTSSYAVGSCTATLYTGAALSGSALPVGAGTSASTMPGGWDNTVSSVLIS